MGRPFGVLGLAFALTIAACGGDDSAKKTTPTPEASTDLSAIKTYLLDHTQRLSRDVATMKDNAQQYHDLAEQSGFDTEKLLAALQPEVATPLGDAKKTYVDAHPASDDMEGVVA